VEAQGVNICVDPSESGKARPVAMFSAWAGSEQSSLGRSPRVCPALTPR
jgi:hypothetical protein